MAWVRRRSSAFSRGRSRFRGVSGQAGHWEARIGTFGDRKNVRTPAHPIYHRPSLRQEEIAEGSCQPWQQSSLHPIAWPPDPGGTHAPRHKPIYCRQKLAAAPSMDGMSQ